MRFNFFRFLLYFLLASSLRPNRSILSAILRIAASFATHTGGQNIPLCAIIIWPSFHAYSFLSSPEQSKISYEYNFDEETITKIAAEIGKSIKDTKEIIRAGIDSTHYTDFYRRYADEDGESTAEDITSDGTSNPERLFFKQWQIDALFDAYESLDYRERTMVADHLGFCTECYGIYELGKDKSGKPVKLLRKSKAYIDLAAEHTLSSPDTAFRIVNGAYEKLRKGLTEKEIY